MSLSHVCLLVLAQFGFGSLAALLLTDRAAVGPKYAKLAGWVVVALYGLALSLAWPSTLALALGASGVLVLAHASVAGWDRPILERVLLALAFVAGGVTLFLSSRLLPAAFPQGWFLASALGSALVLGFTTWAMILGHWYLVAPGLDIGHLRRLVRPLPWLILAKAALSGLLLLLLWERFLGPGNRSLDELLARSPERVLDVVNVWARIPVGLLVPAGMAWMTLETVRLQKTQPATGILYAMCGLVYLGELMGLMVLGGSGVPL